MCSPVSSKCFYSNLLYKRNLQRPNAIRHFPRALVENQMTLLQDAESDGFTLPALRTRRERKWGQFEVFEKIFLSLFRMVRLDRML